MTRGLCMHVNGVVIEIVPKGSGSRQKERVETK